MGTVACVGECMIELSEHLDGRLTRGFGGDTLNTAVYLARLGVDVDYITALGDDAWSSAMIAAWQAEGVGTDHVRRVPGRLPGLYIIQTDTTGERRFSYWRDRAPARDLFATPSVMSAATLAAYSHVYLSGISLSLYGASGRATLSDMLDAARSAGTRIVFDTNYRPRGWPDIDEARAAYENLFARADIVFASTEDMQPLFGDAEPALRRASARAEIVLKHATPTCTVIVDGAATLVEADPVADVVDTTAAGDSFAAGYLAARLRALSPCESARIGHRVAGAVVRHRGAVIPSTAMPKDLFS